MHVERWESEFQGDEGCLKADCSVKDRLGRKHTETQCGKGCFSWLLELPAVQQWSPRELFEDVVGAITLCLAVGCSVAGEQLGLCV